MEIKLKIDSVFNEMSERFPQMKEYIEVKREDLKDCFEIKKEERKAREDKYEMVEKRLKESINPINTREIDTLVDDGATTIEQKIKRIKFLSQKLNCVKLLPLEYAVAQGNIFASVKKDGRKEYSKFIKDVNFTISYANFLINLAKLINKYKILGKCNLPIRFFKQNFALIKDICKENKDDWKEENVAGEEPMNIS